MNGNTRNGWIQIKCLEVTQPIGTFYVGVINSEHIVKLAFADIRRIEGEWRSVETHLGIERPLNSNRVAEIKQYVTTKAASFPSSIIVAVDSVNANYEDGTLYLEDKEDVAKVLDGQHRIAGLEGYSENNFELLVTIFIDIDIETQSEIFATINLEQTKVNKSLAYDLFEYAKKGSPQKTAHNIALLLHRTEESPFEGKIKILGTARDRGETISQALFVDSLLPYLSDNPAKDRDLLRRSKPLQRATAAEEQHLIFRNMWIDEKDEDIAMVLWNYFGAVDGRWGEYWREPFPGNVLNRTTGFRGLMQFLRYAYLDVTKPGEVPSRERFDEIFARVRLKGSEINPDEFPPGSSGPKRLRERLCAQSGLE